MNRSGLLSWLMVGCCCWPRIAIASDDAPLRAAFIYNFIKFIEWPALTSDSRIRLCALDDEGEMHQAVSALAGRSAGKWDIDVAFIPPSRVTKALIQHCQILYIANAVSLLPSEFAEGVVVVADEVGASNPAVGICLHRNRSGRIEFSINSEAIHKAHVTVSSQLLKLAADRQGGP